MHKARCRTVLHPPKQGSPGDERASRDVVDGGNLAPERLCPLHACRQLDSSGQDGARSSQQTHDSLRLHTDRSTELSISQLAYGWLEDNRFWSPLTTVPAQRTTLLVDSTPLARTS